MAFRPPRSATVQPDIFAVVSETNPATITDTPRTVMYGRTHNGHVADGAESIAWGRVSSAAQTGGMSTLYVDQVQKLPDAEVQGGVRSAINQSRYAPFVHVKHAFWLYKRWDPIFRFANTAMDMRFGAGHVAPLSQQEPGNIPSTARMGPYAAPYRAAYVTPRFSTEPYTIVPQSSR